MGKDELLILKLIRIATDVVSTDSLIGFSGLSASRVQDILRKLTDTNILEQSNLKYKTNKNLRAELDDLLKDVKVPDKLSTLTEDEKSLLKEVRSAHRDPTISEIASSMRKSTEWVKKIGKQLVEKGVLIVVGVSSRKKSSVKKKSTDGKPVPPPEEKYRSNPIIRSELDKFLGLKKSK